MVQPDVAREELEHARQPQVAAAAQRGVGVAPVAGALPVGVLELVLDVEEPDARRAREQQRGNLHEQELAPPDQPAEPAHHHGQRDVGRDHAAPAARPRRSRHQPRLQDHRVDRPEPEHHQRVPEQAVPEPSAPRRGPVLLDRERVHVADSAPVQVTGGRVVDRVSVSPALERRVHDHAQDGAQPGVGALRRQERAVRAIVEDDEGADLKAGGRDRQRQHQQVRDVERQVHEHRAAAGTGRARSRRPAGCVRGAARRTARELRARMEVRAFIARARCRSRTRRRCRPRRALRPSCRRSDRRGTAPSLPIRPSWVPGGSLVNRVPGSTTSTRTRRGHCHTTTRSDCSGPAPLWRTAFVTSSVRSRSTSARVAAGSLPSPATSARLASPPTSWPPLSRKPNPSAERRRGDL